jgi:hypothetical protein
MSASSIGSKLSHAADQVAADAHPWIEPLARAGYSAKALLYATIGFLAAGAALGMGGSTTDTRGAMTAVLKAPFGPILLLLVAIGLMGYGLWRVVEAITDPGRRGRDARAIILRASFAARGIVHAALAITGIRLAAGWYGEGEKRKHVEEWTARLLELPAGGWIVWSVAAAIGGYGAYQLYRAFAAKLSGQLDVGRLSSEVGRWVIGVSRFGIGARGVVFVAIAILLSRAAAQHDPSEAGGIADSLRSLAALGRWPLAAIGLGLIAYGSYELLNARYRRIRPAVTAKST